jgi:hypothetical protein
MSRLSPALARRLDRLARHAHRFHRFAHHPLCGAYAGELLRLGRRTRLCRGCALAALGALAGAATGLLSPRLPAAPMLAGAPLLAAWAALAFAPRAGRSLSKWTTRAGPAALAGFLVIAGLRAAAGTGTSSGAGLAAAASAAAVAALGLVRYRRRGPDRAACTGCPQAPPGSRCDGYRGTARRERAFSRLAARWINRSTGRSCDTPPL